MIKTIYAYVVCCDNCGKEHKPRCAEKSEAEKIVGTLVRKCQWNQPRPDTLLCPACSAKIFGEEGKP